MGILGSALGWNTNPIYSGFDANRNTIGGLSAGLVAGLTPQSYVGPVNPNPANPIGLALQGAQAGRQQDTQLAQAKQAVNASLQALAKYPDIQQAVQSKALTPQQGYDEAFKRMDMRASGANQSTFSQTPVFLSDPQGTQHAGQMSSGGGIYVDGKTLPGIPQGWTVSDQGGTLSPDALDMISTQYLAGDKSAVTGYARNATMRAQIANAVATKANAQGMDGKAIAAEISAYGGNVAAQRAAGTRAAQVGMAASEANQMADVALQASATVPRGSLVPWNAAENAVRTGTSSPEMAAFVTATTSLVNAYARAVSPLGAPTDAMRAHAEQMLNTAQSPEAYAAVIGQMKKEMQAALNAPAEISSSLKSSITGTPPPNVDYKSKYGLE